MCMTYNDHNYSAPGKEALHRLHPSCFVFPPLQATAWQRGTLIKTCLVDYKTRFPRQVIKNQNNLWPFCQSRLRFWNLGIHKQANGNHINSAAMMTMYCMLIYMWFGAVAIIPFEFIQSNPLIIDMTFINRIHPHNAYCRFMKQFSGGVE